MPNPAPVSRPEHRVDLVPDHRRLKVVFAGTTIADSAATLRVEETGHGRSITFRKRMSGST